MLLIMGLSQTPLARNAHLNLNFQTKKWTVDDFRPWPAALNFPKEGTFEVKEDGRIFVNTGKPGEPSRLLVIIRNAPINAADTTNTGGTAVIFEDNVPKAYQMMQFTWIKALNQPPSPGETPPANVLPVGRFSPAPGIWVERNGTSVKISGVMELTGPAANSARAQSIEHCINETWTKTFEDGFSVSCRVIVRYRDAATADVGEATQIEAAEISGPSHVFNMPGCDRSIVLNSKESNAFTWTPAHEFGHIIGLKDRYSEGIMSKLWGMAGGTRSTTIDDPRYQSNLMAIDGGQLESMNIKDIAEENEPWAGGGSQVREWLNSHSTPEIRMLSTSNKLKMIQILMAWWVSDEDVSAIERICGTVESKAEADKIRAGVDPLDLTNPGQRMRVRIALRSMPGGDR